MICHPVDRRTLYHYPRQRLGSREPHQHAAALAELALRALDSGIDALEIRQRPPLFHANIHQQLRIGNKFRCQRIQIFPRFAHRFQHPQRRQQPVAGGRVIAKNNVSRLLSA